jgi:hypothetical protein
LYHFADVEPLPGFNERPTCIQISYHSIMAHF